LPVIDKRRRVIGMVTSDEISRMIRKKKWKWKLGL
jgi:Mg/Co/Ni transporter MgtE